jgi:hypothetical protein
VFEMALTLGDAQKLTNNVMVQGIIEALINESAVLRYLPFLELNGQALLYNQEATLAGSSWYNVGDTWTEQAVTVTQKTASLKILGGDVDVDNYLNQTFRNPNQLRAEAVVKKAKAIAYGFNQAFFYGSGASGQPAGLASLVTGGQTRSLGVNGASPTLDDFDALIDLVKPGKQKLRRASGNGFFETDYDQWGRRVEFYDGIPVEVDDNIPDTLTVGSSSNCSQVFAVQFGYQRGVMGLTNDFIQADEIGPLETKDAFRTRIKWYVGLLNFRDVALATMTGVLPN